MATAKTANHMSPKLQAVAARAQRSPQERMLALAHVLDPSLFELAYKRIEGRAAIGVDGVTKEAYGLELQGNLEGLHERMKRGQYRHQPIRRVQIPKSPGKTRPIGISTVEDKVVQNALTMVLTALYEPVFLPCSHGFRPGRKAHDALRAVQHGLYECRWKFILEADIQSFFDSLERPKLMEMLRERVADESFLRLVGKCLHVGVLDGLAYTEPEVGTAQGSTLSPMLGNIYLHHVLDVWFEGEVRPRLRGGVQLVRYADDFVIGFEREDDARRVQAVLGQRLAKYGLTLHPGKTRLLDMRRPSREQKGGKGPNTFDFLGFTAYWRQSRKGHWVPGMKTRKGRLATATKAIGDYCRLNRHAPVATQHAALQMRLRGHYGYFGINGNIQALDYVYRQVRRLWRYWLSRRSQRGRMSWERYTELLEKWPLPQPRVTVTLW